MAKIPMHNNYNLRPHMRKNIHLFVEASNEHAAFTTSLRDGSMCPPSPSSSCTGRAPNFEAQTEKLVAARF